MSATPPLGPSGDRTVLPVLFLVAGALLGFATVLMGAVAAHLPDRLLAPDGRPFLRAAVEMQGWHAPALLACGILALQPHRHPWSVIALRAAGFCFLCGMLLFATGLYARGFHGPGDLTRAAPFGGSTLMLAWLLLAAGAAGLGKRVR